MAAYPWQVLGLDGICGETEIRKAYARLLKTTRPDEDPAGFQKLVEARDRALALAAAASGAGLARPVPVPAARPMGRPDRPEEKPARPAQPPRDAPAPDRITAKPVELAFQDRQRAGEAAKSGGQPIEIPLEGRATPAPATPKRVEVSIQGRKPDAEAAKEAGKAVRIAIEQPGGETKQSEESQPAGRGGITGGRGAAKQAPALESTEAPTPSEFWEAFSEALTSRNRANAAAAVPRALAALDGLSREQRFELEPDTVRALSDTLRPEKREGFLRKRHAPWKVQLILGLEDEYGWLTGDRRVHRILPKQAAFEFLGRLLALRQASGQLSATHEARIQNAAAAAAQRALAVQRAKRPVSWIKAAIGAFVIAAGALAGHLNPPSPRMAPYGNAPLSAPLSPYYNPLQSAAGYFDRTGQQPLPPGTPVPAERLLSQSAARPSYAELCGKNANPMLCNPGVTGKAGR
jgi:hypothetical protein